MIRFARVVLVAIAIAAAGCGGKGGGPAGGSAPTETATERQAQGVAPCWRDVAGAYRAASAKAFPILGDYVPDMVEQYEALIAADAGSDEAAFKRAYDRLFATLRRTAREAEAFLRADDRANEVLAGCNAAAEGDEAIHACWNKAALAHEAAAEQAVSTLGRHLQTMFDAFEAIFAAAARKDDAAVAGANKRLAAAFEAMTPGARTYATRQGVAERLYTACSGEA